MKTLTLGFVKYMITTLFIRKKLIAILDTSVIIISRIILRIMIMSS